MSHHPENILLHPDDVGPCFKSAIKKYYQGTPELLTVKEIAAVRLVVGEDPDPEEQEEPDDRR